VFTLSSPSSLTRAAMIFTMVLAAAAVTALHQRPEGQVETETWPGDKSDPMQPTDAKVQVLGSSSSTVTSRPASVRRTPPLVGGEFRDSARTRRGCSGAAICGGGARRL
jgi:hypothetical protein